MLCTKLLNYSRRLLLPPAPSVCLGRYSRLHSRRRKRQPASHTGGREEAVGQGACGRGTCG